MLFVDFKQTFDSIDRAKIQNVFDELEIPKKLTRLIMMTLKDIGVRVLVQGTAAREFTIRTDVRQRDELSTTIFNLFLHHAVKDIYKGGHIIGKSYQLGVRRRYGDLC